MKRSIKLLKPILLPLKNFFDNILYLFRHNISKRNISNYDLNNYLDNLKYELEEDLKNLQRPKIENPFFTIEKLITENKSVCRFGDGEFELLEGRSIGFQQNSSLLEERLKEILISDNEDILICIPHYFWYSVKKCNELIKSYTRKTISAKRSDYEKLLLANKQYYATEFTQLYMTYNEDVNLSEYFERLKAIWDNRDVTLIQGEGITKSFLFNIFENAKSVSYIYGPAKNAFSEYHNILNTAKSINKNQLILIILGPTATVLAYDLAKLGYQALDIGHTAKDYDFYKRKMQRNADNIQFFYTAD
jgi:glycosyltransferase family protein